MRAMAIACRERFQTDFGLAVGPLPVVARGKRSQQVHFALASAAGVGHFMFRRSFIQTLLAIIAPSTRSTFLAINAIETRVAANVASTVTAIPLFRLL